MTGPESPVTQQGHGFVLTVPFVPDAGQRDKKDLMPFFFSLEGAQTFISKRYSFFVLNRDDFNRGNRGFRIDGQSSAKYSGVALFQACRCRWRMIQREHQGLLQALPHS